MQLLSPRLATTVGLLTVLLAEPGPAAAQSASSAVEPYHLTLGGPAPKVRTEADLRAFLDELEVQQLMIGEATSLEAYYQWRGETRHFVGPFSRLSAELVTRRDYAAVLDRWRGQVRDSTLARRLELWRRDFLPSRADPKLPPRLVALQTSIQDTVSAFRFDVRGVRLTATGIAGLIDTSADRSLREAAFRARPQISAHTRAPILRALGMIDRIARQEGFPNGAAGGLTYSTLEPAQVLRDLDAFEQSTRPAYLALLDLAKQDLRVDRLEPWDIDYWLHLQETAAGTDAWPKERGLTRLRDLMLALGFAFDSLPIRIDVREVPTGGITFPIRPPFEARLLTNPFNGSKFYETLFHEYGHAANFTLMRPDLPLGFFRGDETPLGEGLAETLGHFAYDRHWLARVNSLSEGEAARLERVGKMSQLLWLRRVIGLNAYFEISQYLDRRANLDSLYAATYRRFVGVELPAGDYFATRDLFATGPLYFQSYLYAGMIAAQLREAMREQFGTEDLTHEPRVAQWLTDHFFAPGASIPWPEKIRRATGRPLSTEALSRYFVDVSPPPRP
jgi:peptidyl-dipeptidase A